MLRNNTYKGIGVNVEYQPDFTLQGINQTTSGGGLFSHDFIPLYNNFEKNRLSANSFLNRDTNETQTNTQTVNYIGKDSTITQDNVSTLHNTTEAVDLNGHYLRHHDENTLSFDGSYKGKRITAKDSLQNSIYGPGGGLESGDIEHDSSVNFFNGFALKSSFDHNGYSPTNSHKLTNWNITHSITLQSGKKDSALQTNFTNITDPALNLSYDRKYNDNLCALNQSLSMTIGDFSTWLFSGIRQFSNFHIQLKNDLQFDVVRQDNLVNDIDPFSGSSSTNDYLTANSRYSVLNEVPDLRFGRNFQNILANRYQKELSIYMDARTQLYSEKNVSTHEFQDFNNSYHYFVPEANIEYYNFQYAEFLDKYDLNFALSYDYPTVDQRVALVDSSNIYFVRAGDSSLTPTKKYELSAKFRHESYGSKNAFVYEASVLGGIKDHYFADSTNIDLSGRYTYHTINLNGNKYLTMSFFLNKAFVYSLHQFQINMAFLSQISRTPGYLQYATDTKADFNATDMFTNSDTLSISYTYKDFIAINLTQHFSYFRSEQKGLYNSSFSNTQSSSKLGISLNLTKRLSVSSNATYNSSITSGPAIYRYTIWNASMAYRFLPSNNLELKASALDLLNQNKGVLNYGNNLSYTHGTVNMLRQYFIMTLTYYPRRFGKK